MSRAEKHKAGWPDFFSKFGSEDLPNSHMSSTVSPPTFRQDTVLRIYWTDTLLNYLQPCMVYYEDCGSCCTHKTYLLCAVTCLLVSTKLRPTCQSLILVGWYGLVPAGTHTSSKAWISASAEGLAWHFLPDCDSTCPALALFHHPITHLINLGFTYNSKTCPLVTSASVLTSL